MALEDRNLEPGTTLVARYKGKTHRCDVVRRPGEDTILYRLEDGREFKSPSSAGSAVMGGTACNGWRFWSLDDGKEKEAPKKKAGKKAKAKKAAFKPMPPADGQAEHLSRYFCDACCESFTAKTIYGMPKACPKGHKPDQGS